MDIPSVGDNVNATTMLAYFSYFEWLTFVVIFWFIIIILIEYGIISAFNQNQIKIYGYYFYNQQNNFCCFDKTKLASPLSLQFSMNKLLIV